MVEHPSWEEGLYEKGKIFSYENFVMELNYLAERSEAFKTGMLKANEHDQLTMKLKELESEYDGVKDNLPVTVDHEQIVAEFKSIKKALYPTATKN